MIATAAIRFFNGAREYTHYKTGSATHMGFKGLKFTLLAALISLGTTSRAETISITTVSGHPDVFRWVKHLSGTFIPAVDQALQGSGQSISWTELYGGTLAPVGGELEAIEEGLAELGVVPTVFEPAKMSPQNITYYTPFVSSNVALMASLLDELQVSSDTMRNSWTTNQLEYLGGAIGIDDYLLMTTFPVSSLEDLKRRRIAAPGPAVNWLKGTGAIGVSGNLTTYYNEIKAGVYDGVITFASAALPGKLHEVAPHILQVGLGAQYGGGLAANKAWFDAQMPLVQEALKAGAVASRNAYQSDLKDAVNMALNTMKEEGAIITIASDELRSSWAGAMDNVAQDWADSLDASGKSGSKLLNTYMQAMRDLGATPIRDWSSQ